MGHVLVVDDEESICWSMRRLLSDRGHSVDVAATAEDALDRASTRSPDVILLDVRLPGMDGLSALRRFSELSARSRVIVMTAFGDLDTAVQAFGGGALEYLPKPFDAETVTRTVERALGQQSIAPLPHDARDLELDREAELLGSSHAMQQVFKRIALVVGTDASVLITGESGTGKELVARAIHRHSARYDRPFVPVNLAALSPSLIESELFGHARGAFTGADQDRAGLLTLARDGTLFLDEVGDVPANIQVKLLRVMEQREYLPVGSTSPRATRFRCIAATSRRLENEVAAGRFREDFFYRLAVFHIHVPPLRERPEDIAFLARHFVACFHASRDPSALTDEALSHLVDRKWPGNVRELRNCVESAVILSRGGPILAAHLPDPHLGISTTAAASTLSELARLVTNWVEQRFRGAGTPTDLHARLLGEIEPALFAETLRHCGNNQLKAAAALGIHRATLRKKYADRSRLSGEQPE